MEQALEEKVIILETKPAPVAGEIAALVVAALEEAGYSQRGAADATNLAASSFHRKLQGDEKYEFTMTQLLRIAALIGLPPASFLPEAFRSPCSCSIA
ncbi:hypothetical protein [Leucobacter chromiiresistens]|uniref:hypothetical protein n=1 Tax=Leucobacter chromiiresistens TaxID=1079994 RepID=UPI00115FF845|nr:hypothetical protein [Leucobacter chromiiresistens]